MLNYLKCVGVSKGRKSYGLSDNGLRKRCIKLEIPLPPVGYWAKLEAGKASKIADDEKKTYINEISQRYPSQ